MANTDIDDWMLRKSSLIMRARALGQYGYIAKQRQALKLAARLELRIANALIQQKEFDDAIINLVSAASCFRDARMGSDARRALEMADSIPASAARKGVAKRVMDTL